jgi:hypothetical protein
METFLMIVFGLLSIVLIIMVGYIIDIVRVIGGV